MASDMESTMQSIAHFRDTRGWMQFHTPPHLASSISIEAAELLELFQWGNVPTEERLEEELADVLIYCLSLASVCGIEPLVAIERKMAKNAVKYPVP